MTFNSLTVVKYLGDGYWECVCTCGRIKSIRGYEVTHDKIKSCGECLIEGKRGFKDLTGKYYGEWRVLSYAEDRKWLCECSCGTKSTVDTAGLVSGRSKSCGHNTNAFQDLTGSMYGYWKVIGYTGNKKWLCKCTLCGDTKDIDSQALKRGLTYKCKKCAGLDKRIDLSNKTFGKWEVLKPSDKAGYMTCKCSCGNIKDVHGASLRYGLSLSCGCKGKTLAQHSIFGDSDLLKAFIAHITAELGYKPSSYDLAEILGVNYNSVNRRLSQDAELKAEVNVGNPHTSKYEAEIYSLVRGICGDAVERQRGLLSGAGRELDIYVPSLKVAIEFNGNYWHSSIYKDRRYHQQKTIDCAKQGIRLIHVFEYEWINSREKIINLVVGALQPSQYSVGARNCKVVTASKEGEIAFLEQYHLQGYIRSDKALALRGPDNAIIAMMTFGKPRFNVEFEWELLRFVCKNDIQVHGGASKLFKHFISEHKPKSILTYTDISKFTGNVYTALGFNSSIHSITEPNYVWVMPSTNEVISRYRTTKSKLLSSGLGIESETEDDIMQNLGYVKIYNSGNIKFEWRETNGNF